MLNREELLAIYECNHKHDCSKCPYDYGYFNNLDNKWYCSNTKLLYDMYVFLSHEAMWYEIAEGNKVEGSLCECSNCGDWQLHYYNYVPKYCPNCGCKMNPTVIKKEFDNEDERMDTEGG